MEQHSRISAARSHILRVHMFELDSNNHAPSVNSSVNTLSHAPFQVIYEAVRIVNQMLYSSSSGGICLGVVASILAGCRVVRADNYMFDASCLGKSLPAIQCPKVAHYYHSTGGQKETFVRTTFVKALELGQAGYAASPTGGNTNAYMRDVFNSLFANEWSRGDTSTVTNGMLHNATQSFILLWYCSY